MLMFFDIKPPCTSNKLPLQVLSLHMFIKFSFTTKVISCTINSLFLSHHMSRLFFVQHYSCLLLYLLYIIYKSTNINPCALLRAIKVLFLFFCTYGFYYFYHVRFTLPPTPKTMFLRFN